MQTGEIIGNLAKEKGINLRQLSIKADVPYNTLYAIVKRKSSRVDVETLLKIAKALDVHLRDLSDSSWLEEIDRELGPEKLAALRSEVSSSETNDERKPTKLEQEIIELFLKLDDPARSALLGYANRLAEEMRNKPPEEVPMDIESQLERYRHGLLMGIATAQANYTIPPEDVDVDSITLTPELKEMVDNAVEKQRRILEEEQQKK